MKNFAWKLFKIKCRWCNDIDVIVLFTSGPHLRHNYHGNKTLETMLSGSVEFVGHRLNRPVLLHLCVCRVLPINNATGGKASCSIPSDFVTVQLRFHS